MLACGCSCGRFWIMSKPGEGILRNAKMTEFGFQFEPGTSHTNHAELMYDPHFDRLLLCTTEEFDSECAGRWRDLLVGGHRDLVIREFINLASINAIMTA